MSKGRVRVGIGGWTYPPWRDNFYPAKWPQARELVLIAVLVALCVASRAALFMVPHFKPMLAMVIICGLCLGAESG